MHYFVLASRQETAEEFTCRITSSYSHISQLTCVLQSFLYHLVLRFYTGRRFTSESRLLYSLAGPTFLAIYRCNKWKQRAQP